MRRSVQALKENDRSTEQIFQKYQEEKDEIIELQCRTPHQQIAQLVEVWESSVRATHHFLSDAEVEQIKQYVPQALTEVAHLFVAQQGEQPVGFMGIEKDSLEMLFPSPAGEGKTGKQLLQGGIARGAG